MWCGRLIISVCSITPRIHPICIETMCFLGSNSSAPVQSQPVVTQCLLYRYQHIDSGGPGLSMRLTACLSVRVCLNCFLSYDMPVSLYSAMRSI